MLAVRARAAAWLLLACSAAPVLAGRSHDDPVAKVIGLLKDLKSRVQDNGRVEDGAFTKYMSWCGAASQSVTHTIEAATAQQEKFKAQIDKLNSDIESSSMKIEELGAALAATEADLERATTVRKKEAADFAASEKELMLAINTLDRASNILERQGSGGAAALTQLNGAAVENVLQSLTAVIDAASFSNADRQQLVALVQATRSASDTEDLGAPAPKAYETHGADILEVIEDLRDKAEVQLGDLRKAEDSSRHNYAMLEQSLKAEASATGRDMAQEKAAKAAAEEAKAVAEDELTMAAKELANAKATSDTSSRNCEQTGEDHEATVKGRQEELAALDGALQALQSSTSGAAPASYSLLQLSVPAPTAAGSKTVELVRRLAREQHSAALAQLASRVAAVLRYGARSRADPFAKVKGLIQDMIEKLQEEAGSEATEKAFCDQELAKTAAKRGELSDSLSAQSIKIEQAVARAAGLREEVKELQVELATLVKEQAELDKIRQEVHEAYLKSKADLQLGLNSVRKALNILRDYYGTEAGEAALLQDDARFSSFMEQPPQPPRHEKSTGAGSGIIGLLEVVESHFAESLAKEETQEADAKMEYERMTQQNAISKIMKDKDVEYKTKEIKSLDKDVTELASSKDAADTELAAVAEYYGRLQGRCTAKPLSHEERTQRREAEIQGLKDALAVLESEAALIQRSHHGRRIRGSHAVTQRS